jgi:transcriptional regulator with XRE-family HTH domain
VKAYEIVSRRVDRTGITVSELARRTDIDHMALRSSLHGKRTLKADELISLSRELDLQLSDFYEAV